MAKEWEQTTFTSKLNAFNITMELPRYETEAVISLRGDQHIGLRSVNINKMKQDYINTQNKYKGRLLVIDLGDLIENKLKRSVGHNYDAKLADPDDQIRVAKKIIHECDEHLYTKSKFNRMDPVTPTNSKHARHIYVIGNHEYRSRKDSGIWLNKVLTDDKGILDGGIQCLIKLKIVNKAFNLSKTYRIWCAHRLSSYADAVSLTTIQKNFEKRQSIVDADIYACGHYHKKYVIPTWKYASNGSVKKILYATCPSPAYPTEYSEWALYSPLQTGYSTEITLPIHKKENAYSLI